MRWQLALLVPLALLLFQATEGVAQGVPVTVTLMAENNAVTAVEFPDIAPETRFDRPATGRIQYLVGLLAPDSSGQYSTRIRYYTGGGSHTKTVFFASEATCKRPPGATEGNIDRIACSVLENGAGVVCAATYDMMANPPATCVGTFGCIQCAGVKVCGANPQCAN